MDKAERSAVKWRRRVQKQLRGLQGDFAKFAKLAAAGGVAAAGAFTIMAKEGLAYVDAQAKMARQIGASIDGLRALQLAGEDAGVATDTLNGAVDRMNARLGEARTGSGQAYEALNRLGLSADALANMDADRRIAAIADRVQELGLDSADTADLLRDLGIRNREMVNLLMQGGDAIRAAREEVDEYGLSLSEVDAAKVEAANDAFSRIPRLLEPVGNQIAINLADPMVTVADRFNEAARAANGFELQVNAALSNAVKGTAYLLQGLDDIITVLGKVKRFQEGVFALYEQNRLNVTQGYGRMSNYGLDNPPPKTGPATEQYEETDAWIRARERGEGILSNVVDMMDDWQQSIEQRGRDLLSGATDTLVSTLNESGTLGSYGEGMITPTAIGAAEDLTASMARLAETTRGTTETEEDKNDETDNTTRAVRELGNASSTAARAMAGMGGWGKGALGTIAGMEPEQDNGMLSVRQRIEAGKDLSAYWLEPNPTATPTWSTEFAPQGYLETAAQVSSSDPWSSISKHAEAGGTGKHLGTLTLSSEKAGTIDVKANEDELTKWLADALSAAAAGSPSR
ncbi:hypothetical protein [Halomonas sp.]|uniref:hypothetical protein n=1 Tax=Halomonas sp. TaxID=1486246 RepID=UPI003D098495